ncbi:MAG: exodeoxyribonuclease VII small subunit [Candidatus Neomarinimicrobiota bacterium]
MAESKKSLSFEEATVRLEEIVRKLEDEAVSLEESLRLFEEGIELTELCRERLDEAELKIKKLARNDSGKLKLTSED